MEDERVTTLEETVAKLQARDIETQNKLDLLLASLAHLTQSKEPTPEPFAPVKQDVPPPKTRTVRPASPPDFDGDRMKGLAFLNSCQTYIRLCPKEFLDEQTKIVWAMSYMKSGRAQKWTARIFRWEQQPENLTSHRFLDWEHFRDEFKKEFTPAHSDSLAINRLESTAYYQKGRPLDDYVDEFQDLIADAGYTDPRTIVVKFRRGLNAQVQNAVATMASGRPSDTDPEEWFNMARVVDQNRATNEAFQSAYRGPAPPSRPTAAIPTPSIARLPNPAILQKHAHSVPPPGNPIPMDVDALRKRSALPPGCFRCGKPGHFSKNCPEPVDIRTLSIDELQEILEDRLAQLDVAPEEPPHSTDVVSQEVQDFQADSE